MPIYLDDQPLSSQAPSLGSLLDQVSQSLHPDGRVVVEVRVDGQTLVGPVLQQARPQIITTADIRLYSADLHELALSTLRQLRESLAQAQEKFQEAAESFQTDQPSKGMQTLAQALDIWHQLPQAISHTASLLQLDLNQLAPSNSIDNLTSQLASQLTILRQAVQNADALALADTLAYQWPVIANNWDQLLINIINHIEFSPS